MQTQLIEQLKSLRLRGMANALEESLTALSQKKLAPTSWLGQLLQAEMADRKARSRYVISISEYSARAVSRPRIGIAVWSQFRLVEAIMSLSGGPDKQANRSNVAGVFNSLMSQDRGRPDCRLGDSRPTFLPAPSSGCDCTRQVSPRVPGKGVFRFAGSATLGAIVRSLV
jgi:hypothetical protein